MLLEYVSIGLYQFVVDRHRLADFTIFVVDMQRLAKFKSNNSAMVSAGVGFETREQFTHRSQLYTLHHTRFRISASKGAYGTGSN